MIDLIINDSISLVTEHFCIKERPNIPSPEMEVERIFVEGRDGELVIEKGFKNINYSVEINCLEDKNVKPYLRKIKHILRNSETISFSDDPDVFYKTKTTKFADIENEIAEYGSFSVTFELDPFQYFKVEPLIITKTTTIKNEGLYYSKPSFKIFGTGNCDFKVNGQTIRLASVAEFMIVDSEIEECYKNDTNLNTRMTGEFPTFNEGDNAVAFGTGVTSIEIEPRWRAI